MKVAVCLLAFLLPLLVGQNAASAPQAIRILLGGDVLLARNVAVRALAAKDPAHPFRTIAAVLSAADLTFVNLESPFSDRGLTPHGMVFKGVPEMIAGLKLAGVDIVSTANNHARDRGEYGLLFTLDHLAQQGIFAVGTAYAEEDVHAGAVLVRNGIRFGFLAYTYDANNGNYADTDPRIAVMNISQMQRDVAGLKSRADVVLISMHAGQEYNSKPHPDQVKFARAAIDAGAQVVIGHHPHVRQPVEEYRGGVIFYSLGNLVFDQTQPAETKLGSLAEVVFHGAKLASHSLRTVDIVGTVPQFRDAETPTSGVRKR